MKYEKTNTFINMNIQILYKLYYTTFVQFYIMFV